MMRRWTDEEEAKLVTLIHANLDIYSRKWHDVSKKMGRSVPSCKSKWKSIARPRSKRGYVHWTAADELLLIKVVVPCLRLDKGTYSEIVKGVSWTTIATHFPGRAPYSCSQKWAACVGPRCFKFKEWSTKDDRELLAFASGYAELGADIVWAKFPHRFSHLFCRRRWRKLLVKVYSGSRRVPSVLNLGVVRTVERALA